FAQNAGGPTPITEPCKAYPHWCCAGMSRLPSALHAGPRLDHPWARDGHALVAPPVEAGIRPGRVADEPRAGPSPERVGPVRPPDQGVLGRPPRLTPAGARPAPPRRPVPGAVA